MNRIATRIDTWFRRFTDTADAPVRLVCFPHAGGSATFYLPMARAMAPEVDVLAVQYPGHQDRRREPCLESITDLADAVVDALAPALDRPFALFGHSLGASVAFEVATRLRAGSTEPVALFVSGRQAPTCPSTEQVRFRDDDALLAQVCGLAGTDPRLLADAELRQLLLPAIRADYRAAAGYRWAGGEPLTVPLHVHTGDQDPMVALPEARAWQDRTTGRFTMTTYSGGHFYLSAHTDALVSAVTAEL